MVQYLQEDHYAHGQREKEKLLSCRSPCERSKAFQKGRKETGRIQILMRIFDPITEFDECQKAVNSFLEEHRIDPYTPEEIAEIMKPVDRDKKVETPIVLQQPAFTPKPRPDYE